MTASDGTTPTGWFAVPGPAPSEPRSLGLLLSPAAAEVKDHPANRAKSVAVDAIWWRVNLGPFINGTFPGGGGSGGGGVSDLDRGSSG